VSGQGTPVISHALVALQFSAIAVMFYPFETESNNVWWLSLSVAGVLLGIYTLLHNRFGNFGIYPEPIQNAQLITSGPYRWIRHPMYSALLLFMFGIGIYNNHVWGYLALGVLVAVLLGKIHKEEQYLMTQFPGYSEYCEHSKRLVPYVY
jgi:protein-S-isoprenylcysteine O-methyltransferase Ste14